MPAAAVGAAGTIAGSIIQGNAADDAARMQSDAANRASELQYKMYQQNRDDQTPYREAGVHALSDMQNPDFQHDFNLSDFQKDPGYDFRMQEGQKALERSAAARGGLGGGATLKALSQYGQNFASNEYNNAYNRFNGDRDRRYGRLSSLAGYGQNANEMGMRNSTNYANQAGQNMMSAGNAQAASSIAKGNIWGNTLSGLGKMGMDSMNAPTAPQGQPSWMQQQSQALGGQSNFNYGGIA